MNQTPDLFDLGLDADLAMFQRSLRDRRRILKMGAAGIGLLLAGCGTAAATPTQTLTATALPIVTNPSDSSDPAVCVEVIPQETVGPYPADGSNASNQQLNILSNSGIVRSDIRTSLGTGTVAEGIPATIVLTLVNTAQNCTPLAGYAFYIWHCDRAGRYSLYSSGATAEDYLRGVQATDANGVATFTTIFPACYAGRWPHVHFEIYPSLASATGTNNIVHTSQLALPQDVCETVYATAGYEASVNNLSRLSLATDNVFRDGVDLQMASVVGSVNSGYTIGLTVGISV
jgi:protocatechuate 3,4-dioxygenase beta subunit